MTDSVQLQRNTEPLTPLELPNELWRIECNQRNPYSCVLYLACRVLGIGKQL